MYMLHALFALLRYYCLRFSFDILADDFALLIVASNTARFNTQAQNGLILYASARTTSVSITHRIIYCAAPAYLAYRHANLSAAFAFASNAAALIASNISTRVIITYIYWADRAALYCTRVAPEIASSLIDFRPILLLIYLLMVINTSRYYANERSRPFLTSHIVPNFHLILFLFSYSIYFAFALHIMPSMDIIYWLYYREAVSPHIIYYRFISFTDSGLYASNAHQVILI